MVATNQSAMVTALQEALGAGYEDYSLEGLWHAYWDGEGIAAGPYNQRLLAWLNSYLGTSHQNLPRVMQLYAESEGFYNWSSITAFVVQTVIVAPEGPTDPPLPEQDADDETSVGVTSDTISFNNAVESGNTIILAFSIKGTESVDDITDNQGNIYSKIGSQLDTDVSVEMWIAERVTGGSVTITITYTGTVTGAGFSAVEIENTKGKAPVDYSSVVYATGGGGSSNPVSVTGNTPDATYNLWLAAMSLGGGGTNAGIETPTGWTEFNLVNDYTNIAAGEADYKQDSTGTAQTASWSNNTTTSNYAAMIVAIKNIAAANTTVDGEGEVAAIVDDGPGTFYNLNDITSLFQRYEAYNEIPGTTSAIGDSFQVILDKSKMGGQTAASYLASLPNLVTNGTFDADSDWSLTGATISGGTLNFSGGTSSVTQQYSLPSYFENDSLAILYFEITEYTSGTFTITVGSGGNAPVSFASPAVGEYVYLQAPQIASPTLAIASSNFNGKLDNVRLIMPEGYHAVFQSTVVSDHPTLAINLDTGRYGGQFQTLAGEAVEYPDTFGVNQFNSTDMWFWGNMNGSTTGTILLGDDGDYAISFDTQGVPPLDSSGPATVDSIKANGGSDLQGEANTSALKTAYEAADDADGMHWVHYQNYDAGGSITNFKFFDFTNPSGYILHGFIFRPTDVDSLKNNERRTVNRWLEDMEADKTNPHFSSIEAAVVFDEAALGRFTAVEAQIPYDVAGVGRLSNIDATAAYNTATEGARVTHMHVEVIYTPV